MWEDSAPAPSSSAKALQKPRRSGAARSMHQRFRVGCFLFVLLAVLLLSALYGPSNSMSGGCARTPPMIVSHRGVEAGGFASEGTIAALIDAGVDSFDLDLFWTSDFDDLDQQSSVQSPKGFFIGHPLSVLSALGRPSPMSALHSAALTKNSGGGGGVAMRPLHLSSLLDVVRGRRGAVRQISLELKEPDHPQWRGRLFRIYEQLSTSGVVDKLAFVSGSARESMVHREAQAAAGTSIPLHRLVRDVDATLRDEDGSPRANLSEILAEDAASGTAYAAWSISIKLLNTALVAAAKGAPVSVWVIDDEVTLRRALVHGASSVITNRPAWAARETPLLHARVCDAQTGG